MMRLSARIILIVAVAIAMATAQSAEADKQDVRRQATELSQQIAKSFGAKDYAAAADQCRKLAALVPSHAPAHYNLACALSRLGKSEAAVESLAQAIKSGYRDPAHMKADEDLAAIRDHKGFGALVAKARENEG